MNTNKKQYSLAEKLAYHRKVAQQLIEEIEESQKIATQLAQALNWRTNRIATLEEQILTAKSVREEFRRLFDEKSKAR